MYRTCPQCGHTRALGDPTPSNRCPACGLLFDRWLGQRPCRSSRRTTARTDPSGDGHREWLDALLAPPTDGRLAWLARIVLLVLLAWLGLQMVVTGYEDLVRGEVSAAYGFMHRIDLVFHEAGHVIFRPFGELLTILGGSLMQLIVPLVVAWTFLFRYGNPFGASVGLWWTGQSLADLAPYIADARALRLQLLGGGTGADRPGHDWEDLLATLGLLRQDKIIAGIADALGIGLMALALVWAAALLWRQRDWLVD